MLARFHRVMFDISDSDFLRWLILRLTRGGYRPTNVCQTNIKAGLQTDVRGCKQPGSLAENLASIRGADA